MEQTSRAKEILRGLTTRHAKKLWNPLRKAVETYQLIQPDDHIAVCISGGKDSLLLALLMQCFSRYGGIPFDLQFLSIDPGYTEEHVEQLQQGAQALSIPLTIAKEDIFQAAGSMGKNPCFYCSRLRRARLYARAQEMGCNKIALGHHYDDVVETILMGMLYGGQIQTMMPKLYAKSFPVQVIRPLYLVREADIRTWAQEVELPTLRCSCRITQHQDGAEVSKRQTVKALLAQLRQDNPQIEANIFNSVSQVDLDKILGCHRGKNKWNFLEDYGETSQLL